MSLAHAKREVVNKENIGPAANLRKASEGPHRPMLKECWSAPHLPALGSPVRAPSPTPQAAAPYVDHILQHLLAREETTARPSPDYMLAQRDINPRMRSILVDWLVDVTLKFRMRPPTLFMTVALIDRFLSAREVARGRLQLVGVAALMIVGKYEEIYPPLLKDYVAVCDSAYSKQEVLAMESEMLLAFNFDLNRPSAFVFLEFLRSRAQLDERGFAFARYLLESALVELGHLRFSNATLAAGALFLVNKIFKREAWPATLQRASGVPEATAKLAAKELFDVMGRAEASTLTALRRKFADAAFFEVSKYRIEKVPAGPSV